MSTAVVTRGISRRTRPQARSSDGAFRGAMWMVGLLLLAVALLLVVRPALLRPVFPAAVCLIGYRLYRRNESYFLSFLLWITMLAPLLRRLVDWRASYQEPNLILIAPLLLMLLPAISFPQRLRRVPAFLRSAVLLCFSAILFGAGVGMIRHPGTGVILAVVTWSAPIVLCVFAATLRERDSLTRVLTRTFAGGVLLMAIYGVYQFVAAPPWDVYWLEAVRRGVASIAPSFGQPRPFEIRVWSTMNAPGPFAVVMSAALLWLATQETGWMVLISLSGYAALLLSLVRSAWLQTALGLVILLLGTRPRLPLRGVLALFVTLAITGATLYQLPEAADIRQRIDTLSNLHSDASANEREDLHRYMANVIARSPLGDGMDTEYELHGFPLDSSLVVLFYKTGWIGGSLYLLAMARLTFEVLRRLRRSGGGAIAAAAIFLTSLTQIAAGDILFRQGGLLMWLFVGIWTRLIFSPVGPPRAPARVPLRATALAPRL